MTRCSLAEMRGAVVAASVHNTYVAAHAASSATIRRGLEAGIRSFEHAYRLDRDTAHLIAQADAFLTPTLVVTHLPGWKRANGFAESSIERSQAATVDHVASIRHAIDAGVTIVNGTDVPPGERHEGIALAVHEMALLGSLGVDALAVIQSATRNAARLVGAPELGLLAEGGPADLIAVDGNPIADVLALSRIRVVIKAGMVAVAP